MFSYTKQMSGWMPYTWHPKWTYRRANVPSVWNSARPLSLILITPKSQNNKLPKYSTRYSFPRLAVKFRGIIFTPEPDMELITDPLELAYYIGYLVTKRSTTGNLRGVVHMSHNPSRTYFSQLFDASQVNGAQLFHAYIRGTKDVEL